MDRIGLRFLRIDAQFTSVTSIVNHTRGNNLRRGVRHGDNEASGMNNARRNYAIASNRDSLQSLSSLQIEAPFT